MGRLLGVALLRFTGVAGLHLDHKRSGAGLDNGHIRMLLSGSSRCRGAIGIDRLRCRGSIGGNPRTLQACRTGSFESFPYFTTKVTFAAAGANENVALLPSSTPLAVSRLLCQKLVAVR